MAARGTLARKLLVCCVVTFLKAVTHPCDNLNTRVSAGTSLNPLKAFCYRILFTLPSG